MSLCASGGHLLDAAGDRCPESRSRRAFGTTAGASEAQAMDIAPGAHIRSSEFRTGLTGGGGSGETVRPMPSYRRRSACTFWLLENGRTMGSIDWGAVGREHVTSSEGVGYRELGEKYEGIGRRWAQTEPVATGRQSAMRTERGSRLGFDDVPYLKQILDDDRLRHVSQIGPQ